MFTPEGTIAPELVAQFFDIPVINYNSMLGAILKNWKRNLAKIGIEVCNDVIYKNDMFTKINVKC